MGDVYQIYTRDILGWGPAMAGVMVSNRQRQPLLTMRCCAQYSVWGFMASLSGLVTAQAVQFFGAYRLTQVCTVACICVLLCVERQTSWIQRDSCL